MSQILAIRHLPTTLSFPEKEEMLRHFGAQKVWEIPKRKYIIFALFPSIEDAKIGMFRMHQHKIGNRRLVVEYARTEDENHLPPPSRNTDFSEAIKNLKEFINKLFNVQLDTDFCQPFPPNLRYKYPEPDHKILINIMYWLMQSKSFYNKTLHLMNMLSLPCPIDENSSAIEYFLNYFQSYFSSDSNLLSHSKSCEMLESEAESEISSDQDEKTQTQALPKLHKRKKILPITRKRPSNLMTVHNVSGQKKILDPAMVFEDHQITETKKICLNLPQGEWVTKEKDDFIVETIPKMETTKQLVQLEINDCLNDNKLDVISRHEILQNKLSDEDMKTLSIFKNYSAGEPSTKIYLKNLAKTVTGDDVKKLYRRYIQHLPFLDQELFDVRIMQEGRMKGQGFVTFPSVEVAKKALHETNGYILFDKPIVVQFARTTNK